MTHQNLLSGAPGETRLPADPAAPAATASGSASRTAAAHPDSLLAWARLAEEALDRGDPDGDVAAYAYARTGYHRGLDALRRSGWRGSGQVPWEHEPNRGWLRSLAALSVAAGRLGETDEQQRCAQFLRDSSETAYRALLAGPRS